MKELRLKSVMDAVIDTDAFNEVDDQYAIAYALKNTDRISVRALYAAPFLNENSASPADGMEKSYGELLTLLKLAGREDLAPFAFRGSDRYLPDEKTPVPSDAARDLVRRAKAYSPERPLYVVAIAAITNVASALLMDPGIARNVVVVWMGGHARHWPDTNEFNMKQDVAAARVVFSSGAQVVQLPGMGVLSEARVSKDELERWLVGKNELADHLALYTIQAAEKYAHGTAWTRVLWDVTAVAWLLSEGGRFMREADVPVRLPTYEGTYSEKEEPREMRYVYWIDRDALFTDMFRKLAGREE